MLFEDGYGNRGGSGGSGVVTRCKWRRGWLRQRGCDFGGRGTVIAVVELDGKGGTSV